MKFTEVFEPELNEINMSPTSLDKLAGNIEALAGMEFEMIVPDVDANGEDDFEPEADYDQDEPTRSFSRIRDFFHDGDFNGRRQVDRLEQRLIDDYYDSDFLSEKKQEAWNEAAYDAVRDLVDNNYADDLRDQATDEVSKQIDDFGTNDEEFRAAVLERYNELVQEKVDSILADMGREYDEAYEEWEQNEWQELATDYDYQEEWLEHEGLEMMSDIQDRYDITWPHYTEYEGGDGADIDAIADEFSDMIGKDVNASSNYHGARREKNKYVVEPDGSLDPDNSGDAGLEFVSPPMPINELLADLEKVKAWADGKGCYTNDSTGLHINVSVPNFSMENLDYVKLALLLGDKYVLNEFQRMGNHYCKSAMEEIKTRVGQRPEDAANLLDAMKKGLGNLATKVIHSGSTSKYTSINTKTGYIEFRSPGGDWLGDDFYSKIKPTLLRFVVALDAAVDPQKYREEYLKKLYAVLQPKSREDTLSYFARFAAGELPKSALVSFVKQAQLERKIKKDPTGGQKYWWEVSRPGYFASIQVVASSKEEAIDKAIEPGNYPDWASAKNTLQAKPIKPFDSSPVRASVGEPQPVGQQTGQYTYRAFNIHNYQTIGTFQAGPPGSASASQAFAELISREGVRERDADYREIGRERQPSTPVPGSTIDLQRQRAAAAAESEPQDWEMFDMQTGQVLGTFRANGHRAAEQYIQQHITAAGGDPDNYDARPVRSQSAQQPATQTQQRAPEQGRQTGQFTGQWKIVLPNGREVHRFGGVGNSQADANRIAAEWLRNNGMGVSGEGFEVVPIMSGQ
jgi:hypothetical protein